jgi:hypothetical protein
MDGFAVRSGRVTIDKSPLADLTYSVGWSKWLDVGDTIASAEVTGTGVTVSTFGWDDTTVTLEVTGGTAGVVGSALIEVTTAAGAVDARTVYFDVKVR